jgi:TonB family protein
VPKAPAAPVAAAAATPAPKPVVAAAPAPKPAAEPREKTRVATAGNAAAAANGTPAPTTVAMASIPAPAPLSDAPYPSALSSPSADKAAAGAAPAAPPAPEEQDPGLEQIKSVQPDFPGMVVKRVRKGNVEVRFEVEPGGTVSEAVVVESSNHKLNDAAIEAIKQWRFKPTPMYHTAAVNLVFDIDKE